MIIDIDIIYVETVGVGHDTYSCVRRDYIQVIRKIINLTISKLTTKQ